MTRRDLVKGFPLAGIGTISKEMADALPSASDILRSFDAREWATNFELCRRANPSIALDPECMTSWFANALMRGYDEGSRETEANAPSCPRCHESTNKYSLCSHVWHTQERQAS